MKLRNWLLLGGLGYGAYKAYQNRQQIVDTTETLIDEGKIAKSSVDNIQANLDIIKDQTTLIKEHIQDFNYKKRVFNQEIAPKVDLISEKLNKLSSNEK